MFDYARAALNSKRCSGNTAKSLCSAIVSGFIRRLQNGIAGADCKTFDIALYICRIEDLVIHESIVRRRSGGGKVIGYRDQPQRLAIDIAAEG